MTAAKTLAARLAQFHELLSACACTDAQGVAMAFEEAQARMMDLLTRTHGQGNRLFLVGNGGSAAVASHAATDVFNAVGMMAHTLHDTAQLTCMANDFGYEQAYARLLSRAVRAGDVLVAISSSGRSRNICAAAEQAKALGARVVTLSGFAADNPLRAAGELNYWLDSRDYGLVEIGHQFILHNLTDRFLEA
ncbi:MAG: SIS domain-containing protein [Pseudomonadota bacterium]